jgi:hypothetical protein
MSILLNGQPEVRDAGGFSAKPAVPGVSAILAEHGRLLQETAAAVQTMRDSLNEHLDSEHTLVGRTV